MNILVTGGTGFIGSHLVENLVAQGHSTTILSNSSSLPAQLIPYENVVRLVQGDFGDSSILENVLVGIDQVVHLAWTTVPQMTSGNPIFDVQSNVIGTVNLLEKCVKEKICKIVFVSSGGTVYGIPKMPIVSESHPLAPISSYGICKLSAEKYIQLYYHLYGLDYAILRVSNAYGEYQNLRKGQGVIGVWLQRIKDNKTLEIWGDGSIIRDYVYVKDLANAISLALGSSHEEKVFNIGTGIGYSLNDLIEIIRSEVPSKVRVDYKESRKIDVPVNILSNEKAKEVLNWKPATSIDDGIRNVWNWIRGA